MTARIKIARKLCIHRLHLQWEKNFGIGQSARIKIAASHWITRSICATLPV